MILPCLFYSKIQAASRPVFSQFWRFFPQPGEFIATYSQIQKAQSVSQKKAIASLILANSADPDEMPPYAAFHLGFHCLPKCLFTGI